MPHFASPSRTALRAFVLAGGLVLAVGGLTVAVGGLSLVSASPAAPTRDSASEFRNIFGLAAADEAFAKAPVSPTAIGKWGVDLTAAEEADMDARAALQEQLGGIDAIVVANGDRIGGVWLDQRASHGNGFIVMIAFVDSVDGPLLDAIRAAAPVDAAIQSTIVTRSATQLEALMAHALDVSANDVSISGVSIVPQDNAVLIGTVDGTMPNALADVAGYEVVQDELSPIGCTSSYRCTTRPYRGGMEIQDRFGSSSPYGWEECTSAFMVRRSGGALAHLTAAHCQIDYNNTTVYTMNTANTTIENLGTWGADTVPAHSPICATVCDMDVEVQLINSIVLTLPSSKNRILYSSSDTAHVITGASSWSTSWVGHSVCAIGITMNLACGSITSVGTGVIEMAKESFARINKGAYAYLANVPSGGDSGGPVLSGATAYGINSGVSTDGTGKLFFSAVSPALTAFGASLCVTNAC